MSRSIVCTAMILLAANAGAAEQYFDFSGAKLNEAPPGFRSVVSGNGKPGEWKIIEDTTHASFATTNTTSSVTVRKQVLAQLARDPTDEHFSVLVYDGAIFGDFTLTTRFKTVEGAVEQMAGLAFPFQNESNYYVVRASSLGNTFRFYKFVDGTRSTPVGPDIEIPNGAWHELQVECAGNQIRCSLDGRQAIPTITDHSFLEGKVGFWTKSDSVSYFSDTKIVYTPKETLATSLVRETLRKYPRLLGLKIFATTPAQTDLHMVASNNSKELGQTAGRTERDVIANDAVYCGRGKKETLVTLPMHDRNGDAIAAVRVVLRPFPGQTEQNAVVRAAPLVKEMEARVRSARDLTR